MADVRIAVVGDVGVGKTTLLLAFTKGPDYRTGDGPVVVRLPPVSIAPEAIAANTASEHAKSAIKTTLVDTSGIYTR